MQNRKLLIGPYQLARLEELDWFANHKIFLEHLPHTNFPGILYSSIIQAGVERVEIVETGEASPLESSFRQKRVSFHRGREFARASSIVEQVFRETMPIGNENDLQSDKLKSFLIDLLHAAARKSSLAWFSIGPTPNVEEVKHLLTPELYLPIRALFASMENEHAHVAVPSVAISAANLDRFNEVISGRLFKTYEASHGGLDEGKTSVAAALKAIDQSSRLLTTKNSRFIKQKRIVVSLLPVTAKLIDVCFGKLPGILAEFSTNLLGKWLQDDRRIVIYRFDDVLRSTLQDRMHGLINARVARGDSESNSS
jgi:hypothetical protein